LTAGVLIGAIYGQMCVGLALIVGVMRVINFADFFAMLMHVPEFRLRATASSPRRTHGRFTA
jgi:branched-chain amino acid transport system permease protein